MSDDDKIYLNNIAEDVKFLYVYEYEGKNITFPEPQKLFGEPKAVWAKTGIRVDDKEQFVRIK